MGDPGRGAVPALLARLLTVSGPQELALRLDRVTAGGMVLFLLTSMASSPEMTAVSERKRGYHPSHSTHSCCRRSGVPLSVASRPSGRS